MDKKDVLKMVVDKAKAIIKETNPSDDGSYIPDDIIIQAIQKELKQLNQTRESLEGRGFSELYLDTLEKIDILNGYLPKMMSLKETEKAVTDILSSGDYSNFGMQMKAVISQLKGKADSNLIKEVVQSYK